MYRSSASRPARSSYRATISQTPSGRCAPASLPSNQDRLFPQEFGRTVGRGTNVILAKPTADSRRTFVRRACARSGRPIRSAHGQTAHEAVDRFSPSLPLRGGAAGERPAVGWQANIPQPYPVLFGVGATLGWQSYGDAAKEMLVARAPVLAWVLSVSTTKPPVVAATSTDPMPQLAPLASNLDVVRRGVEQLAAKQEQLSQNIAALKAVEEDIRQKMSSAPPAPAPPQQAASIPQPKPPQPKTQSSAVQSSSVPRPPPPAGPQFSR